MAKLTIDWTDLGSTTVTTGVDAEGNDLSTARAVLGTQYQDADKPFVVYLTSSDPKALRMQEVVEGTTLMDERIAIGAKAFTMVRGDGDLLSEDHPFHRYLGGKSYPRFVVFSADGTQVGRLEGQVSPSKLFGTMKKAFKRDYVGNLDRIVKDYQKVLTQLDTIDTQKQAIAEKEARAQTARDKKELARKKEEIAKEEEAVREAEEKVLDFKRRVA